MASVFVDISGFRRTLLGRGGSGCIFECTAGGRQCALKVSHRPSACFSPLQWEEAHVQHQLGIGNPGVLEVYGVTIYGDIVMELCPDGDLRARMTRNLPAPLEPRAACRLLVELAECLRRIHGRGWIHGDVKPSNILLSADAEGVVPRLADFGNADVVGHVFEKGYLEQRRCMAHSSPFGVAGPQVDLHALCVLCLELVLWRPIDYRSDLEQILGQTRFVFPCHGPFAARPRAARALLGLALSRLKAPTPGDAETFASLVKHVASTHLADA